MIALPGVDVEGAVVEFGDAEDVSRRAVRSEAMLELLGTATERERVTASFKMLEACDS